MHVHVKNRGKFKAGKSDMRKRAMEQYRATMVQKLVEKPREKHQKNAGSANAEPASVVV
jgi:hypothetical protein